MKWAKNTSRAAHWKQKEKYKCTRQITLKLWRIVFVDGKMNRYEHHLMGKLKNLLHLTHDQLIDAKLKVKNAD